MKDESGPVEHELKTKFRSACADQLAKDYPNKESFKKFCRKLEALQWAMTRMRLKGMESGDPDQCAITEGFSERPRLKVRSLGIRDDGSDDNDSSDRDHE